MSSVDYSKLIPMASQKDKKSPSVISYSQTEGPLFPIHGEVLIQNLLLEELRTFLMMQYTECLHSSKLVCQGIRVLGY